jgi:transcriptional regulator with XRE-family HTH domain
MTVQPVGIQLRQWRQRRRLSQLDLAGDADISARHLSFVETGRSLPSREMVLHLCEHLDVPARERNVLLVAAGYAPVFFERPLNDPSLKPARDAIDAVLNSHKPYPCFAIDRHWNIVASNLALPEMYEGMAPELRTPPINALRLALHPKGLAPRTINLGEWRAHLLTRLAQQVNLTADHALVALLRELSAYPSPPAAHRPQAGDVLVPFRIATSLGELSFFSTTMVFGTPVDITLSELAIESFFPADAATVAAVKKSTGSISLPHA